MQLVRCGGVWTASSPSLNMRQLGVTAWLANLLVYGLSIQTFQVEKASLKDRVSFWLFTPPY